MGLIDVVREAQDRRGGAYTSVCSFPLEPSWLTAHSSSSPSTIEEAKDEVSENRDAEYFVRRCTLPPVDDALKSRIEEEERLTEELSKRITQEELSSLSQLEELIRPYLEKTLPHKEGPSLAKLLKKALPLSGRGFLCAMLQASVALNQWQIVSVLLENQLVSGYACTHMAAKLVEAKQTSVLCSWIRNVHDPRPSDLLLVLKFFLSSSTQGSKSFASVHQQWKRKASSVVDNLSKALTHGGKNGVDENVQTEKAVRDSLIADAMLLGAAIDGFSSNEVCLHYLVASGQDEVLLASIMLQLDTSELLRLFRYLVRWLKKYSVLPIQFAFHSRKQGPWIPTLAQVLQWVTTLFDGQYTTFILCSEFHPELRALQSLIKESIAIELHFSSLFGIIEHIRSNAALPAQSCFGSDGDHIIEYLEI